jgi:hypothetical protein
MFDPSVALWRLMYAVWIGCGLILLYGLSYVRSDPGLAVSVISIGIMAGGAATLAGGLIGFLFGVPHASESDKSQRVGDKRTSPEESAQVIEYGSARTYTPSTSLEQIADWLTKILVGVGLIEIRAIPGKFVSVASFIASGLGPGDNAQTLALAILIYFSVCGFIFAFLWARIYLARWFREADEVKVLEEKVDRLEKRHRTDARALALINQQINRIADEPGASEAEIADAIKAASSPIRAQIFSQAERTSANKAAEDYELKLQAAISVFRGLIKSDTNERYHRNHSELGHALRRMTPPDWKGAAQEFTKAIEIRDKLKKKGWKSYEFYRAESNIKADPNFEKNQPSDEVSVNQILSDLQAARTDTEKWKNRFTPASIAHEWVVLNNIDPDSLTRS